MNAPRLRFTWLTRSPCPACKSLKTRRYASSGPVQYRACECGHRFKVHGQALEQAQTARAS